MGFAAGPVGRPAGARRCCRADAQRPAPLPDRTVVAVLMFREGRLCLLRRSHAVGSDRGRWHCVTGFVDSGVDPDAQALIEVREETGLTASDLETWRSDRCSICRIRPAKRGAFTCTPPTFRVARSR